MNGVIRGVPLFEGLDEEQVEALAAAAAVLKVGAGSTLVRRGEPADRIYVVLSGIVRVVGLSNYGRGTNLRLAGPGEALIDTGVLEASKAAVDVVGQEAGTVLVIPRDSLMAALRACPEVAIELLAQAGKALRHLQDRTDQSAFLDVPSRLARALMDLAARFGERQRGGSTPAGIHLGIRLSQQELGDLVGATRESVNKHLSEWTRQAIISMSGGRIVVNDIDGLRRLSRFEELEGDADADVGQRSVQGEPPVMDRADRAKVNRLRR